jgi:hypothetical protein
MQLLPPTAEQLSFGLVSPPAPIECDKTILLLGEGEITDRGMER